MFRDDDDGDASTRDEHLAWCKRRAFEYVDTGDLAHAVANMESDLKTLRILTTRRSADL
jgi:hypothetical protein